MKFINQIYQDLYERTNDNSPHNCDKGTTYSYIDDGSHILSDQLCAFELLKDKLSPKGTYIIEDLQSMSDAKFMVDKIPNSYIIDLRHIKNRYDDIMVVLKKY